MRLRHRGTPTLVSASDPRVAEPKAGEPVGAPAPPLDTLLTKRELARRWGVSERSIERWMHLPDDPLPYVKPFEHGMVRYDRREAEDWLGRRQAL